MRYSSRMGYNDRRKSPKMRRRLGQAKKKARIRRLKEQRAQAAPEKKTTATKKLR